MGDPRPGQIPDNIFISVQQLKMKSGETGLAGDILVKDGGGFWRRADLAVDITIEEFAQARVDFDTQSVADGEISIEALTSPSYIYAIAGGVITNGSLVQLNPIVTANFSIAQTLIAADKSNIGTNAIYGKFSRLSTDSAGNNDAVLHDVIIVKLGGY